MPWPQAFADRRLQIGLHLALPEHAPVGGGDALLERAIGDARRPFDHAAQRPEERGAGLRRPAHPGEDQPMHRRHANLLAAFGDRADRRDEREQLHAVVHLRCGRDRIGSAARDSEHREPVEPERVGERGEVLRRAHQGAALPVIRMAVARPVGGDDPQAPLPRRGIGQPEHEARARRAVQRQHRQAARIAEFGEGDAPAVGKAMEARGAVLSAASGRSP